MHPALGIASGCVRLRYASDSRAVRRQIVSRMKELADLDAPEVAVDVERLHSAESRGARAGRVR